MEKTIIAIFIGWIIFLICSITFIGWIIIKILQYFTII